MVRPASPYCGMVPLTPYFLGCRWYHGAASGRRSSWLFSSIAPVHGVLEAGGSSLLHCPPTTSVYPAYVVPVALRASGYALPCTTVTLIGLFCMPPIASLWSHPVMAARSGCRRHVVTACSSLYCPLLLPLVLSALPPRLWMHLCGDSLLL